MKFLLSLIAFIATSMVTAQNILLEQYFLNNYLLNPAVSGIEEFVDVQIGHRWQWTGIEGAPQTTYVSVHSPLGKSRVSPGFSTYETGEYRTYKYEKSSSRGIGGYLMNDIIGAFTSFEVGLSVANHLPLARNSFLSFGVSPSISFVGLNDDFLSSGLAADPAVIGFRGATEFNLKLGLWYYEQNLYLGLSSFHYDISQVDDVLLTGGYRMPFLIPKWDIIPFGIARYVSGEINLDMGVKASWNQRLFGGALLRSNRTITGFAGFNLSSLWSLTYMYNAIPASSTRFFSGNTHEINVQLRLNNSGGILCPQMMW